MHVVPSIASMKVGGATTVTVLAISWHRVKLVSVPGSMSVGIGETINCGGSCGGGGGDCGADDGGDDGGDSGGGGGEDSGGADGGGEGPQNWAPTFTVELASPRKERAVRESAEVYVTVNSEHLVPSPSHSPTCHELCMQTEKKLP